MEPDEDLLRAQAIKEITKVCDKQPVIIFDLKHHDITAKELKSNKAIISKV